MKAEDVISVNTGATPFQAGLAIDALRAACGGGRYTVIDHENGTLATLEVRTAETVGVDNDGEWIYGDPLFRVVPVGGERP